MTGPMNHEVPQRGKGTYLLLYVENDGTAVYGWRDASWDELKPIPAATPLPPKVDGEDDFFLERTTPPSKKVGP